MKTLPRLYRGQFNAVDETLEPWKIDHDQAMQVHDLEDVIEQCHLVDRQALRCVENAWSLGSSSGLSDHEEHGRCILDMLRAGVRAWGRIVQCVEQAEEIGYDVKGASDSRIALAELRRIHEDFAGRWPFARAEDVKRGEREISEGKFITAEDLLSGCQDCTLG